MNNIVVIGAQWGDEGKGKIVDLLSKEVDIIARFQGGNNAGHTVITGGKKYSLHLVPSGILHDDKLCVIGNGVVLDPIVFVKEIQGLIDLGIKVDPERLKISRKTHLIMPYHSHLDLAREANKDGVKIGTTGRGIGPSYEDKASRIGVRACDLENPERLKSKIAKALFEKNMLFKAYGVKELEVEDVFNAVMAAGQRIIPYLADVSSVLDDAKKAGKRIMFEGAQGIHLDIDHGTYPFVTSSNTVSGNAAAGCGIGPNFINRVLGIVKAYTTRVGEGPFATELDNETGEYLQKTGGEFGVTTGRKRRCGWLDLVVLRETNRLCGLTDICLTKLDVLANMPELDVCVAYELDGKRIDYPPQDEDLLARVKPIYETLPGFEGDITSCTKWEELPANAKSYVEYIEKSLGVTISMVSVGADRDQTIIR